MTTTAEASARKQAERAERIEAAREYMRQEMEQQEQDEAMSDWWLALESYYAVQAA